MRQSGRCATRHRKFAQTYWSRHCKNYGWERHPEDLLHEATRTLTNKLIHPPSAKLHTLDAAQKQAMLRVVRDLYNLPPDDLQNGDGE